MRQSQNPDLASVLFLAGFVALSLLLAACAGSEPTPVPTSTAVPATTPTPDNPDVTFYVTAYHWDYAIFREDGTRLDTITVPQGTILEIFAVNALAQDAIGRLPGPVAKAMRQVPQPDAQAVLEAEPGPHQWPVTDHGLLLDWFGVIEYLAANAQEPNRVVFTAHRPGEYEFVCTNYCGVGHIHMTSRVRLVVQPVGLPTPTPTPEKGEPPPGDGAELGLRIFTGEAGVVSPPCTACHAVGRDVVGPDLSGVATRAARRVQGLMAAEYLHQSLLEPGAYVVEGWPAIMPSYQGQMTDEELEALIAYLMTLE